MSRRLSEVGERTLIDLIGSLLSEDAPEFGDDVYTFKLDETYLTFKIDGVALDQFILPWMSFEDAGWKAVVMAGSDIIAKASTPLYFLMSVGVPRSLEVEDLMLMVRGGRDAARALGGRLVGGDLNESAGRGWVDVAAIGRSDRRPIGRRGCRPGDVIVTTGEYGLTGAAYHYAFRNGSMPSRKVESKIVEATRRPLPPINAVTVMRGYSEQITSAIDSSDGLATTLWWLSRINGVALEITNIPIAEEAREYAEHNGIDVESLALYGGEEYEVVMTATRDVAEEIIGELNSLGVEASIIGEVVEGSGVWMKSSGGRREIPDSGWEHFKVEQY